MMMSRVEEAIRIDGCGGGLSRSAHGEANDQRRAPESLA